LEIGQMVLEIEPRAIPQPGAMRSGGLIEHLGCPVPPGLGRAQPITIQLPPATRSPPPAPLPPPPPPPLPNPHPTHPPPATPHTRASMFAPAVGGDYPPAGDGRAERCPVSWHPRPPSLRRRGHGHDAAQDLPQDFVARLLEKNDLAAVDPARGRFRSFLLAACQ